MLVLRLIGLLVATVGSLPLAHALTLIVYPAKEPGRSATQTPRTQRWLTTIVLWMLMQAAVAEGLLAAHAFALLPELLLQGSLALLGGFLLWTLPPRPKLRRTESPERRWWLRFAALGLIMLGLALVSEGGTRHNSAMPVHPQVQVFLDMLVATNLPPYEESTVEQARERMGMLSTLEHPPESVTQVQDLRIAGRQGEIPLRIYSPHPAQEQSALLYFHGGGWVVGSVESHDRLCRALANESGAVVVSVDYRLAPEHKFPAAIDDCEDAFRYVVEHGAALGIDPTRVAVGGDSAGGNLAAVVCLRARESGGARPAAQVLLYPATGHGLDTPSRRSFAEGYLLTAGAMRWFSDHYLRSEADAVHPDAAPRAVADLSGLPPALLLTAEFDPLRDEGEEYGQRLERAGVSVTSLRGDGMIHGFLQLTALVAPAREAIDEVASWLRLTLHQTESRS